MKKLNKTFLTVAVLALVGCGLTGCGQAPAPAPLPFSFDVKLDSKRTSVFYMIRNEETGELEPEKDKYRIVEYNPVEGEQYNYTITATGSSTDFPSGDSVSKYIEVSSLKTDDKGKYFEITPKKTTAVKEIDPETGKEVTRERNIYLTVKYKRKNNLKKFNIKEFIERAQNGYNWSADGEVRQEVLGKLEEYAMENFLTGISLFENGGYVKYSARADAAIPATEYITGYGWGLLADGEAFTEPLPGVTDTKSHPLYYQSASSSDPLTINAWNATGSQVSDLNSYISTSYWGTRLLGTKDYEWYPILAQDGCDRPIRNETENPTGLYTKWKIPVKTKGIKYHHTGKHTKFEGREVELEDYLTVYQALLTNKSQLSRGAELAGDTTYGIKGAGQFYRQSKAYNNAEEAWKLNDALWNTMIEKGELGLSITPKEERTEANSYIYIELVNPIDEFTAMYTLSSNLYSPIPREFLDTIGGGDYATGAYNFGTFPDGINTRIEDNVISVGPFYLESWDKRSVICFKRDDDWFEHKNGRYNIEGVRIRTIERATEDPTAVWTEFMDGKLDSAGVPSSVIKEGIPEGSRMNGGDSTFKLNINSCTQEQWDELFGPNGSVNPQPAGEQYQVKPWMSNKNFLKGLYWSINRKQFAEARGVQPSFNYFSNSYMANPEERKSYNATPEHDNAVRNFHNVNPNTKEDDFGFSEQTSINYFKAAVDELIRTGDISEGTASNPTYIHIHIRWMYASDIQEYGNTIKGYFEKCFNDSHVRSGKVKLIVDQDDVKQWDQVYTNYLMKGQYDLGFGAISGNTYNPLNFMEVLKSDNSSGFTLNWGADTSKVDEVNPITYAPEGEPERAWSFDALWAAADHGAVVTQGRDNSPVENCYLASFSTNKLYEGCTFELFANMVEVSGAVLTIKKVQLEIAGLGVIDLEPEYDPVTKKYTITITREMGEYYNTQLVEIFDLEKEASKSKYTPEEADLIRHPFRRDNYNLYWDIIIRYSMKIGDGKETETVFYAFKTKDEQDDARK